MSVCLTDQIQIGKFDGTQCRRIYSTKFGTIHGSRMSGRVALWDRVQGSIGHRSEDKVWKILHVVGSPDSMFYFKQSIFFACPREEYNNVSYHYAIVHTDGLWSFSDSLQDIAVNGILPHDEALSKICQMQPDVIIHQLFCRRGQSEYRGIIQNLGFPVIGSSAEIVAICQSKSKTKNVLDKHGVKVAEGCIVGKDDDVDLLMKDIPLPCVVKPDMAEDSMGVSVVRSSDQLTAALQKAHKHSDKAVLERFIAGREIRVLVMSDSNSKLTVLPPLQYMNIKEDGIRGFEAKYDVDENGFPTRSAASSRPVRVEAEKEPQLVRRLSECTKSAFRALQMRDFGLFDIRVDNEGIPWILEANPFCSFSERSISVGIAKYAGFSCQDFLLQMVENALERKRSHVTQ